MQCGINNVKIVLHSDTNSKQAKKNISSKEVWIDKLNTDIKYSEEV